MRSQQQTLCGAPSTPLVTIREYDVSAHLLARARVFAGGLAQFLLPPACAICRAPHRPDVDGIVCGTCLARLVPLTLPQCHRCGHPRLSANAPLPLHEDGQISPLPPCRWCARLPPIVRAARSVCRMDVGTGAALVHALKYGGWPAVARPMARRMARLQFPDDVIRERTLLVPMPLADTRRRERGYNQAEQIATALSPLWQLPVMRTGLHRIRNTRSQVQLTPSERTRNVSCAFAVHAGSRAILRGAHIVLVDDVITTAATLNAAAHALADGGARIISYVTFGRAPHPGDRTDSTFDSDRNTHA